MATVSPAGVEDSESVALAFGYAQAFEAARKSPATIFYVDSVQTDEIRGVTGVSAHGGVVLVRLRGGASRILDPARIVKMSMD